MKVKYSVSDAWRETERNEEKLNEANRNETRFNLNSCGIYCAIAISLSHPLTIEKTEFIISNKPCNIVNHS